jgi:glycosyltransferase involved in cell wall biosynthesis
VNKKSFSITDDSDRLCVGVVTTSFPVVKSSSSGIFVERLVAHIAECAEVTVLVPCPDRDIDQPQEKPYRIEFFSYGIKKWQRLAHYPGGIPDAIRRRDPALLLLPIFIPAMFLACLRLAGKVDIIHGNWSVPGLIAAIAARMRGRPAITTVRGTDVNRAERSLLFRLFLKSTLMLNRYIVVVSEEMRDSLCGRFPLWADRIVFIPNGVSVEGAGSRPPFRSPMRLLTVGSLIRPKRIETLLSALSQIQHIVNVSLRIVGEGPERDNLEEIANRLSIREYVEFAGSVPPEEVERHLQWADIFVFASESEGRPNVILEAMAAGLPVVATDIPGVRELLGADAGLLFSVGDAPALVRCIRTLISDPDGSHDMGRMAARRIKDNDLTWDTAARRYIALYKDAIEHAGGRPCAD